MSLGTGTVDGAGGAGVTSSGALGTTATTSTANGSSESSTSAGGTGGTAPAGGATSGGGNTAAGGVTGSGAVGGAASTGTGTTGDPAGGPEVDRTNPQLHQLQFKADEADPQATRVLGNQFAYLDTRTEPQGKLVVYLHGAGDFSNCGDGALGTLVASWGFHWFGPCFLSNYGVDNCGDDIEGCRLEAFEGTDHHAFVDIRPPDSIETRIVRGLAHLEMLNPEGDWQYFVDGDTPRWSEIIITGHSHGASTSGVIGMHRNVFRVVMLAGPYDPGQAWLSADPLTVREHYYGFSHTGDSQHSGHLAAFEALGLVGTPTLVDGAQPPFGGSHRLYSAAAVADPHGSVTSGNISEYVEIWRYLYVGND